MHNAPFITECLTSPLVSCTFEQLCVAKDPLTSTSVVVVTQMQRKYVFLSLTRGQWLVHIQSGQSYAIVAPRPVHAP